MKCLFRTAKPVFLSLFFFASLYKEVIEGDAPDLYVCKVKYALPMISEEGVGVGFWEVVSSWGLVGWGGSLAGLQILMHFVQCADMQLHALIAVADARLLGLWV
jgi:hypothetical protein